jgi:UDP-N-acetylglucosamine 1-carboxyvinyltransferase
MSRFIVEGGRKLSGIVTVAGNKNEALPLIAASLLTSGRVTFSNVPDIGDVRTMVTIAGLLGAHTQWSEDGRVSISASSITTSVLPTKESSRIRASVLFASSLLVRTGKAVIIQPGGDSIGRRRLDTHFLAFQAMGATLDVERGNSAETIYRLEAPRGLTGTDIYLDEASVTATENAIIAAAGAIGRTTINNAASEPHVQGLCRFLEKLGVVFHGIGSNVLTIEGATDFSGNADFTVGPDYIEAGSFIGLAAATRSALTISGVDPQHMRMVLMQFERIGVSVEVDIAGRSMYVSDNQKLTIRRDFGATIPRIEDSPWPGFPPTSCRYCSLPQHSRPVPASFTKKCSNHASILLTNL